MNLIAAAILAFIMQAAALVEESLSPAPSVDKASAPIVGGAHGHPGATLHDPCEHGNTHWICR